MDGTMQRAFGDDQPSDGGTGSDEGGESLAAARRAGQGFLAAADAGIDRAMSLDSKRMLRSSEQGGGQ